MKPYKYGCPFCNELKDNKKRSTLDLHLYTKHGRQELIDYIIQQVEYDFDG